MRQILRLLITAALAGMVYPAVIDLPPDRVLVDKADRIALGTIISSYPEALQDGSIRTVYTMLVAEGFRGAEDGEVIEFREWGGVVGSRVTKVVGAPHYRVGSTYLVFLTRWGSHWSTVDLGAGRFELVQRGGRDYLVRELDDLFRLESLIPEEALVDSDPPEEFEPADSARPAELFLQFVRSRTAESGSDASGSVTIMPSAGSVGSLNVQTAVAFGNDQWNSSSIVNYTISATVDTTGQKNLVDSLDVVIPDSSICNSGSGECIPGSYDPSTGGTVAIAFFSGYILSDRINIVDSDIVIQDGVNDTNTSQTTLNIVMTHELGHTLGFRHANQNRYNTSACTAPLPCAACSSGDQPVMCSQVQQTSNGTLESWDVNARNSNYAISGSFNSDYLTWQAAGGSLSTPLPYHRDSPSTMWHLHSSFVFSCTAPSITSGPLATPASVVFGGSSQLTVTASGTSLSYQWYAGSPGDTSQPIAAGNPITVTPAVTTTYWVRISNGCGVINSSSVTVHVEKGADVNGDGKADLLWRNYATGGNAVWFMNGSSYIGSGALPAVADTNWRLAGVGDFNGDRRSDLVWRHRTSGQNAVWFLNGTSVTGTATLPPVGDLNWWLSGVADFDRDGDADLLWQNRSTGALAMWLLNGTSFVTSVSLPAASDTNWRVAGAADMNNDARPDIVWRNYATGANAVWLLDGSSFIGSAPLLPSPDLNWQIQALTDLDGDGQTDLVWRHVLNGGNAVWYMSGTNVTSTAALPGVLDPNWTIAGPR